MKVQVGDPLPSQQVTQQQTSVLPARRALQDTLSTFVRNLVPRFVSVGLDLLTLPLFVVRRRSLSAV